MKLKVSVIIPSYERYDHVITTIESVKRQEVQGLDLEFEIIVVSDGSQDPRYENLSDQGILYKKIEHSGLHMIPMNHALRMSTGNYIAFLDDDDAWMPTKTATQIKRMNETGCKMSSSNAYTGIDFYNLDGPNSTLVYFNDPLEEIFTLKTIQNTNFFMNSSTIMERSVFERVGFFKEDSLFRHKVDYDYWKRALAFEDIKSVYIHQPLIYYRNDPVNSMRGGFGGPSCEEVQRKINRQQNH